MVPGGGSVTTKLLCGKFPPLVACTVNVTGKPATSAPPVGGLETFFTPVTKVRGFSTGRLAQAVAVTPPTQLATSVSTYR